MASMGNAQRGALGGLAKLGEGARTTSDLSRVGGGLSRGANEGKKLNAAPWSDTFPAAGATLDLDFANNRGFVRGVGQGGVMDAITFTRASNGNYVNEDGLLVGGGTGNQTGANLLTFPQDFNNAIWAKQNAEIKENTLSAPDGTQSADFLNENTANTTHFVRRNLSFITSGASHTFSVYLKAGARNFAYLYSDLISPAAIAFFDISQGVAGSANNCTSEIADVGNSWYRCSITFTPTAASSAFSALIGLATTDTGTLQVYTGDGESGIFIWGAQLELGSTATEYFPTNIGEPRFDWASTEQVAQRNLLAFTEQFDNSYWAKPQTTVVADTIATTDPLGTNTADLFYPTSSGSFRSVQRGVDIASLNIKTISVYAKSGGLTWLSIRDNINAWAFFDLTNGVLGTVTSGYTASITDVGDGWYRCVATNTNGVVSFPTFMASDANGGAFVTATGTNGYYLWGAQGEIGTIVTDYTPVSFPTSSTPLRANPTSNGILIEVARTNRLLWNRDATQTEWVKTNITAAKDQTGIDGVANAASSLTATDDNGTCIQTITLAAGNRTGSVYLKRLTGTGLTCKLLLMALPIQL
jgi:hypothetical protein